MKLEIESVDKLEGEDPLTKLWHLYKIVYERNTPIFIIDSDLLVTRAALDELMRFTARTLDEKDCYSRRIMLKLRKTYEDGPCKGSVRDSFRDETKALATAVAVFFLLVWGKTVDTNDLKFLEGGPPPTSVDQGFA